MKKIIMMLVLLLGVLIPTPTVEAKTKTVTVTIKKNSDIPNAVKKLHNNAMKKKATNIKVKGNLNKSRKIIAKVEKQIQQYNGNGVVLLIDATKKPKTSKGYTTYKVTKDCGKCYIYWNKVVDKMEQETVDWVATLDDVSKTFVPTSKPIKYAIGTRQKTFAQLTDYEKVKFIDEHEVFSASRSPKNHVGMYYSTDTGNTGNTGGFLEGNAYGVCSGFAGIEQCMFTNLGIISWVVRKPELNHDWSEIYMQSPETGQYRDYLFDYGLYNDINAKTKTGAKIYEPTTDTEDILTDNIVNCNWGKNEVKWNETYFQYTRNIYLYSIVK